MKYTQIFLLVILLAAWEETSGNNRMGKPWHAK